jgi:RNA polymerase sigma-70 factor, ECF subfamily
LSTGPRLIATDRVCSTPQQPAPRPLPPARAYIFLHSNVIQTVYVLALGPDRSMEVYDFRLPQGETLLDIRLLEIQMQSDTPSAAEADVATAAPRGDAPASEEAILLDAVLKKDRKATAEFVFRYADPVYGYVSQRLAPRADLVEDLVQEVFLVALQKLDTFAGKSSVLGWLLGIARHKVEDLYRARLREPESFSAVEDVLNSDPVTQPEFDELIDRARVQEKTQRILALLPEVYGLALLWRYWEEHSTKEMAAQTGRTEKAMERLLARARAHFRRLWESEGP